MQYTISPKSAATLEKLEALLQAHRNSTEKWTAESSPAPPAERTENSVNGKQKKAVFETKPPVVIIRASEFP